MKKLSLLCAFMIISTITYAAQVTSIVYLTDDPSKPIGKVIFLDTEYGLLITPSFTGLPPGLHGFHLHQHANCANHGSDAGSHFDPQNTNSHLGPFGQGHLGDLPVLYVNSEGIATTPVLAPRLKTSDLRSLSVMIHEGGDTYSDTPPLGGGGARIACGPIQ